jgi:hypothetical protein
MVFPCCYRYYANRANGGRNYFPDQASKCNADCLDKVNGSCAIAALRQHPFSEKSDHSHKT